MKLLDVIVKRSILTLVVWLVLGLISIPTLLKVGEVTEYRAERLLPSGAESIRANQIVLNISGRALLAGQHIVLVSGVNATDPKLVDIDYEVGESVKSYALYYGSPYTTVRRLYSELDKEMHSGVATAYGYANLFYYTLKTLSANRDAILYQLSMLTSYTQTLKRHYESICVNRDAYRDLAAKVYENISLMLNQGTESYEAFRELVKQVLLSTYAEVLSEGFGREVAYADLRAIHLVAEHLAYNAWSGSLTEDYVYRLIVGMPVAVAATSITSDANVVDRVLLDAPLIKVVVEGACSVDSEKVVIDTLYYLATLAGRMGTLDVPGVVLKALLEQLVRLPPNATYAEIVKVLAHTLVGWLAPAGLNVTVGDIYKALSDVLIAGLDPLDVVVGLAVRYAPPYVDADTFSRCLRTSLEEGNPNALYEALRGAIHREVFNRTVSGMRGLMISNDYTSFLVVLVPAGGTAAERAANAYRVAEALRDALIRGGYSSANINVISSDALELEVKEYMSRDIGNVNRVSAIASVLIALAVIGGLAATALPFIGIVTSLAVSHGLMYVLSMANLITLTSWSRLLAVSTALGLGMNYSSYIVTRFKEVYPEVRDPRKAAYEAVKYALPAIIASSSTDIIGFAVMKLAWEFPLIASIGEAVPIAIAIVLAVSLTLTPALLALLGDKRWFWWPRRIDAKGVGRSVGLRLTAARSAAFLALSLVVLGVGVYGFLGFQGSHDYGVFMPEGSPSYQAYVELRRAFPAGKLMPVYVVCALRDGYSAYDEHVIEGVKMLRDSLLGVEGVAEVYSHVNPGDRSRELYVSRDNRTLYLEVILKPSPLSREGVDLTKEVRGVSKRAAADYCKEVLVGGFSASSLEIEEMLDSVFWSRIVPIAIALMMVSMSLSFQSILSGPIAMLSIVIGYFTGIALATATAKYFDQPMLWFLPLMTLPAVLGVGLDYNSYYMNRQRYELLNGRSGYEASSKAVEGVSHVVLGLGLIVVATYASLAIGSSWGIRELGIALSTAVFTTTILASYTLTPALLAILGRRAWWPGCKRWAKHD